MANGTIPQNLGILLNSVGRLQKEKQAEPNFGTIEFDPTITLPSTGESAYQSTLFNEFESVYKDVTGQNISLAKGSVYRAAINLDDEETKNTLGIYKNNILEAANRSQEFRVNMNTSQKEKFAEDWSKVIYGIDSYLKQNLPTDAEEKKLMKERYSSILQNISNNFLGPTIQYDASRYAKDQSVDSVGDLGKRIVGTTKLSVGRGLQASSSLVGRLADTVDGMMFGVDKTVEEWTESADVFGQGLEETGLKTLQEAKPATGKSAIPFSEILSDDSIGVLEKAATFLNPMEFVPRVAEQIGPQAITTGASVIGGGGFSLAARGAGLITRLGFGLAGAAPGLTAGYVLESGDAYGSSRDFLKELVAKAKQDVKRMSPEEYAETYKMVNVGGGQTKPVHELNDNDIESISKAIGQQYAKTATAIEAAGSGLQAGLIVRRAAKLLNKELTSSVGRKSYAKYLTNKIFDNVLGDAAKGVVTEGTTEAIQAYMQETLLANSLPQYKRDLGQVVDSAIQGGYFGGGIQVGVSGATSVGKKIYNRVTRSKNVEEHAKQAADFNNDETQDDLILAGSFLRPGADKIAEALNIKEDMVNKRLARGVSNRVSQLEEKPEQLVNFLKKRRSVIESFFDYDETSLRFSGILTDKQVAELLGSKPKVSEKPVATKKEKRISDAEVNRNIRDQQISMEAKYGITDDAYNYSQDESFLKSEPNENFGDDTSDAIDENFDQIDQFELEAIKERKKELENQPLSVLKMSTQDRDTEIAELDKQIKQIEGSLSKSKTKVDRTQMKQKSARDKLINKYKHLPLKVWTKEEKAEINKLKNKKDISGEELNSIQKMIEEKTVSFKEEISKKTGIKKGDVVTIKSTIPIEGIKGKKAKVLSVNEQDVFVAIDGSKQKRNIKYYNIEGQPDVVKKEKTNKEITQEAKESAKAGAKKVVSLSLLDDIVAPRVYSKDVLDNMGREKLEKIAKQYLLNPQDYENNSDLVSAIVDIQPREELQGAFGAFKVAGFSERKKLRNMFTQFWVETIQDVDRYSVTDEDFTHWVEEAVAPLLPEPFKSEFYDWANDFNPNTVKISKMRNVLRQMVGMPRMEHTRAAIESFEDPLQNNIERFKENLGQEFNQGSDIEATNYNNINSKMFYEVGVTIPNATMSKITQMAYDLSFDDWVKEISKPDYGLLNTRTGDTPFSYVQKQAPQARRLKQFHTSNQSFNNIEINSGNRDIDKNETPDNKRVNLYLPHINDGFAYPEVKSGKQDGMTLPSVARPTQLERLAKYDLEYLNGSDLVTRKGNEFDFNTPSFDKTRYGFLTGPEYLQLMSTVFSKGKTKRVPVFIRGDSDKLGLVQIKEQDTIDADNYKDYWLKEMDNEKLSKEAKANLKKLVPLYSGEKMTTEQMSEIYETPELYRAAQIARHKAYKAIMTDNYPELSAHKLMHRIKILDTPSLVGKGRDKTYRVLNIDDALNQKIKKPLYTVTRMEDGTSRKKNLIKMMDGKLQYVGDGQTITSEINFREDYPNEVGANPNAFRSKNVITWLDNEGLILVKHQQMAHSLNTGEIATDLYYGDEKIVEIRKDAKNYVNVYGEDSNGNFSVLIDSLLTTDEAKVALGKYKNYDSIFTLPSEAVGHIQFVEEDKDKAPFPMQTANYITSDSYIQELNKLIDDDNNSQSASYLIDKMYELSDNPEGINNFIINMESSNPEAIPRQIVEAAKVGAGNHPSQLDYFKQLIKNKLLTNAMKLKQDGGVLDFRANMTSDIKQGNIVMPFNHRPTKRAIIKKLAEKSKIPAKDLIKKNIEDLNRILSNHPVEVQLTRHPIPSRAGYRILKVEEFRNGIGDSFMIHDEDVKEVFEGDHDHDTGHVMVLPDSMLEVMKNEQAKFDGLQLDKYVDSVVEPNLGSLTETTELMGELTDGKLSIGEIANVSRIAGMGQSIFDYMIIDGKKVQMNKLTTPVYDPDIGETHTLENLFRLYSQASFDNVTYRLLNHWNYSQDKLYKMLFYNEDGSPLTDIQYEAIKHGFLERLKLTQRIKNAQVKGKTIDFDTILQQSDYYNTFVQDRERFMLQDISNAQKNNKVDKEVIEQLEGESLLSKVSAIKMKKEIHPNEKIVMLPAERIPQGKNISNIFYVSTAKSRSSHFVAESMVNKEEFAIKVFEKAYGNDLGETFSINKSTDADRQILADDIQKGEIWGKQLRSAMYNTYIDMENTEYGMPSGKIVTGQTWDYNADFVAFTDRWQFGTKEITGYNDLSEVSQVAATFAFLRGGYSIQGGNVKYNVRQTVPHSLNKKDTLLHPDVMKEYYKIYNQESVKEFPTGYDPKDGPRIDSVLESIRRRIGCE
tara:strand:+ start:9366 stop:16337 length:6972 start_codon:yes stop_codon:yes gene_type:complete